MSRRGENIRKRKDGRWEGRYKTGEQTNGKSKYRSVYGKSYLECKEKLDYYKYHLSSHNSWNNMTFSTVLKYWINSNTIRLKGATLCKYQFMIETHIIPDLGEIKINQINSYIINKFLHKKLICGSKNHKALSPSYVKTISIIIEAALKFAISEGWCEKLKTPIYKPAIINKDISILSKKTEEILFFCY